MEEVKNSVPEELIASKIYLIRGKRVMLDRDLAPLYDIETKQLKRAVRRNLLRFPDDFMIEMTQEELSVWRSQFGTSNSEIMGLRIPPFAFTEYGVIMLASILNSERAIRVNIQIVRVFTNMRSLLESQNDIFRKLDQLERKGIEHDKKIMLIFDFIKKLDGKRKEEEEFQKRERIGFKHGKE